MSEAYDAAFSAMLAAAAEIRELEEATAANGDLKVWFSCSFCLRLGSPEPWNYE